MRRLLSHAVVALAGAVAVGCVGSIGDRDEAGGKSAEGLTCADGAPLDPGPVYLRRLTNAEYRETVRGLLGDGLADVTTDFPPDAVAKGFSNNAESVAISDLHVERYAQAAEELAFAVVSDPARRAAVLGCDPVAGGEACVASFIETFGRRAFRRPLAAEEIAALSALAASTSGEGDPWAGPTLVLEAALQSASFLFRVEQGVADPARADRHKLTGYEIATRLAFLLLGRGPDDALLDAAASGALDTPKGVRAAADALIGSGDAAVAMERFAGEWLQLPLLATVQRDAEKYPAWSDELRASMAQETRRFVAAAMWGEGADMISLVDGKTTAVDAGLAALYGLPPPADGAWADVTLPEGRAGVLTQASVLTLTAKNEAASVIRRGKYVRDVLLCDPPPPPPNVPPLMPDETKSAEEQLGQHLVNPVCKTCHEKLDPIGFGFSRYDAIGQYHPTDANGAPIPQAGEVKGLDEPAFDGPEGLAELLSGSSQVSACMVTQTFRYAFGRSEGEVDRCTLEALGEAFEGSGRSFPDLLRAFVESDAFRYRSTKEPE